MRMLILALTLLSLSLSLTAQDKNIVLIPDTLFKAYLVKHFDADTDGEIDLTHNPEISFLGYRSNFPKTIILKKGQNIKEIKKDSQTNIIQQ